MELALTNESGLLDALRAGDEQAFASLVRAHHRALIAVARAVVGESEAEEVVQIAWIKAHKALPAFEGRSALRTWLSRIVLNEARMQLRSRRREVFYDDVFSVDGDVLGDRFKPSGAWGSPPGHWQEDSPEDLLTAEHLQDCLERLMKEMPDNQRALLEMRDAGGIDFDEICNMLEVSASNARVLLHRARGRLYRLVDHYQETGEC
jgi:RNA polymerase sigma-70 factor, ECF subfamily